MSFFVWIGLILFNIVTGLIVDGFGYLKKKFSFSLFCNFKPRSRLIIFFSYFLFTASLEVSSDKKKPSNRTCSRTHASSAASLARHTRIFPSSKDPSLSNIKTKTIATGTTFSSWYIWSVNRKWVSLVDFTPPIFPHAAPESFDMFSTRWCNKGGTYWSRVVCVELGQFRRN